MYHATTRLHEEYEAGAPISDIFPVNSVGIVTARDKLAIQWTAEDMGRIAEDFAARGTEAARTFYDLGKDARDWQGTVGPRGCAEARWSHKTCAVSAV